MEKVFTKDKTPEMNGTFATDNGLQYYSNVSGWGYPYNTVGRTNEPPPEPIYWAPSNQKQINKEPMVKCLECGYTNPTSGQFLESEEAIPLCPKCLSMQLQIQN